MHSYPELYMLAVSRYSCRAYDPAPVPDDTLTAVMDVVRLAPSACNRQPWLFILADSADERQAILDAYPREWAATAPHFIVACGPHDRAWHRGADGKDHTDIDVAIAVEHLCLAAASLGLGTCWVCNFDTGIIREAFALPDGMEPVAIIPIGHPAEGTTAPAKSRKPLEEIFRKGKF